MKSRQVCRWVENRKERRFRESLDDVIRKVHALALIETVPEPDASHAGTPGREDAILGILDGNAVRRNFGNHFGSVKIYGRIRLPDPPDVVRAHKLAEIVCNFKSIHNGLDPGLRG